MIRLPACVPSDELKAGLEWQDLPPEQIAWLKKEDERKARRKALSKVEQARLRKLAWEARHCKDAGAQSA